MANCAQLATAASNVAYQQIRSAKKLCRFHPAQTNCSLIRTRGLSKTFYKHNTMIDSRFCSYNGDPFYEWLLLDENVQRNRFTITYNTVCTVQFDTDERETIHSLEESGEKDMELLRMVMKYIYEYLENDKTTLNGHANNDTERSDSKVYVLFNKMYIQCLYSYRQCIILPQEMYCLYKDGEEPSLNAPFFFNTFPEYEDAVQSQNIYKGFLIYNTMLTMMLKDKNPFNDESRVISKIIEKVGTCNGGVEEGKKTRIKICSLNFGGESPGHFMCPPKEMVKKIYRYAKWRLNPKNYTRYYTMLANDNAKNLEQLREWSIFIQNFKTHFFPSSTLY
ncbi:vp1054 [Matsumuraeses phaseoli granulovirus]|uniref:Vp1054 n=1 Tax=Matsumuraeses phaseoli granulovirus TaxID=2760664 RepID=A0AAE7MLI6_9BBAC|nr:vp1054 [Matsumuraeses phaseoli granulovirus]QOD40086.1 vp1054 [Matsumuraeses phaseoli granulovirus]